MIYRVLWQEFFNRDLLVASAVAIIMLLLLIVPIIWFHKHQQKSEGTRMNTLPVVRSPWRIVILVLGFTFLYAPMLMLVIYSFNSSKLVTVWAGWSTRWYGELFRDSAMISAVGLSLTIAACAATMAAILGTIAAVVMVRFTVFVERMALRL